MQFCRKHVFERAVGYDEGLDRGARRLLLEPQVPRLREKEALRPLWCELATH